MANVGLPLLVGLGLGVLAFTANSLSNKWAGAILLAVAAPSFALLFNDLRKLVLLALVVDIALEFDVAIQNHGSHEGGPTGYLVSLMTIALLVGYILWVTEWHKSKIHWFRPIALPLGAFLLAVVLSVTRATDRPLSLFSVFLYAQAFLMFIYVINRVKTWQDIDLILISWAAAVAVQGMVMIFLYFTRIEISFAGISTHVYHDSASGLTRVGGTFSSVNGAAIWLAPSLVILLGGYLTYSEQGSPLRWIILGAFGLGTVGLIVTFSRGGWASLVLGVSVLIAASLRSGFGRKGLGVLSILALIALVVFSKPIYLRLTGDDEGSAESRGPFEQMAWNMIDAQPLTGVGANNFELRMFEYLPTELLAEFRQYIYVVHNHYLLLWAELGILGLAAFVWMLLAAVRQGISYLIHRPGDIRSYLLSASLLGALAGYSLHMKSDIFTSRMAVQLLWFIIALIAAIHRLPEQCTQEISRD